MPAVSQNNQLKICQWSTIFGDGIFWSPTVIFGVASPESQHFIFLLSLRRSWELLEANLFVPHYCCTCRRQAAHPRAPGAQDGRFRSQSISFQFCPEKVSFGGDRRRAQKPVLLEETPRNCLLYCFQFLPTNLNPNRGSRGSALGPEHLKEDRTSLLLLALFALFWVHTSLKKSTVTDVWKGVNTTNCLFKAIKPKPRCYSQLNCQGSVPEGCKCLSIEICDKETKVPTQFSLWDGGSQLYSGPARYLSQLNTCSASLMTRVQSLRSM